MTGADKKSIIKDRSSARAAMPKWSFQRNVTSMRLMAELAVAHGLTMRAVLSGTDLDEQQLGDPEHLVSGEQELQLIRNLVNGLGDRSEEHTSELQSLMRISYA